MVDLYVNYDCDINGANIFERLTGNLARLVQTKSRKGDELEQEMLIKGFGSIICLVFDAGKLRKLINYRKPGKTFTAR